MKTLKISKAAAKAAKTSKSSKWLSDAEVETLLVVPAVEAGLSANELISILKSEYMVDDKVVYEGKLVAYAAVHRTFPTED